MLFKLMRLEFKKHKLDWYVRGTVIANILIAAFIWLIAADGEPGEGFADYQEVFFAIGIFVRATFIIFASALIARLIIQEYKNKTITLMFMYPVHRRSIILSKFILISGITFLTIIISNIFVAGAFFTLNHYFEYVPFVLTFDLLVEQGMGMLIYALAAVGISLMPVFFGMLKKSVVTTIASSIFVVTMISSTSYDFSLSSILAVPISLGLLGMLLALWSIRNLENVDVI